VVLTLALGIGANSAVFSALDAVLLRPLPFPEADRLVQLRQAQKNSPETNIAPIRLEDWNRLNTTFDAITGYFTEDVSDTSGDLPVIVRRAFVAPRFHEVWGIAPSLGRGFTSTDHQPGGPSVALVSERYWRDQLGADPNAVGRTVRLGTASVQILGVMPASFRFPDRRVDLWVPVRINSQADAVRIATWYTGVGRLRHGATIEQARANLTAVQSQLGEQFPKTDRTIGVVLVPLRDVAIAGARESLWLLFGAVSVLLLITCTNVAALLLARALQRRHETSVRLSLGATRGTVAVQMLTESGILALAGGACGVALATAASAFFRRTAGDLPRMDEIQLDWRILAYTLTVTMTVALGCALLPALRAPRSVMSGTATNPGRTQVSSRARLQWLLVGAQVSLSVTLLASAGLFLRSFHELSRVSPGFDVTHVLTFRVSGSWAETADYPRLVRRIDDTLSAMRSLPGVTASATAIFLPGVPSPQREVTLELAEERGLDAAVAMVAEGRVVSPEYFATMQMPVVAGEPCRTQPFGTPTEVMINSAFAERYFSTRSTPVGLHVGNRGQSGPPGRIVGVVGNAREGGVDRPAGPVVYSCFSAPNPAPWFLVRTEGDPAALVHTVRVRMKELEPLRAVYELTPLEERISGTLAETRLRTTLLALFAIIALTLAIVGLYGTLSYTVALRRREIGLRLALGAVRAGIVRQFLGQGLRVVGLSCVCGLALSAIVGRMLARMLYGVSPSDPATLAAVVAIVLAVGGFAALIPAARAARTEPVIALRQD
jgi:predicted permease